MIITSPRKRKPRTYKRSRNPENIIRVRRAPCDPVALAGPPTLFTYLNADSIKNKTVSISDYVVENKIDILAIAETWLFSNEALNAIVINDMTPQGYRFEHIPRQDAACERGGGVGIMFRDSIVFKLIGSGYKSCLKISQFEFIDCSLQLTKDNRSSVRVIVVYRPPPTSKNKLTLKSFWRDWNKFLRSVARCHTEFLIVGDLNLHLDNAALSTTQKFTSLLDELNLHQHVQGATYTSGHTLDVLISLKESTFLGDTVRVHDPGISDDSGRPSTHHHYAISWNMLFSKPKPRIISSRVRDYRNFNESKFASDLEALGLEQKLIGCDCLENMVETFNSCLSDLINKHAPYIEKTTVNRPNTSWYDSAVRIGKQRKRFLERRWSSTKLEVDRLTYRKYCADYNKLLKRSANKHAKTIIDECQRNKSKLFKACKSILGDRKVDISLPGLSTDTAVANAFGTFFRNKVRLIRNDLAEEASLNEPHHPNSRLSSLRVTRDVPKLSSFNPIPTSDVATLISKSNNKFCCLDPLPTSVVKKFVCHLAAPICVIINKSLVEGEVPKCFKKAIVVPVIKKPGLNREQLSNYRPISNLPYVSKLLERVVFNQLDQHLQKYQLLSPTQSAYRRFHSTETMLVKVTNDILCALDRGKMMLLVALDVSSAFDTVDHQLLINRYQDYFGLSDTVLNWMSSYLADRHQAVQIGSCQSNVQPVDSGFPQGSTLGGPKFNMYATPLHYLAEQHGVEDSGYADDSNLFISFDVSDIVETDNAKLKMEACVADVKTWMLQSKLLLNNSKTEVILFQPPSQSRNLPQDSHTVLGGTEIKISNVVKSLGVHLDKSLKMVHHVNSIASTAHFHLRRISQKRSVFNKKVTETLVNGLVLSRLDYCNSLLCNLPKTLIYKLQKVQNAAAKLIMLARKRDHVTPLMRQLHWLPMNYRCKFKVLILTFKILDGKAPDYLCGLINRYSPGRQLRSSSDFLLRQPPFPRTKYGERAFCHLAPMLWNGLPSAVRHAETLSDFKRMLKSLFFIEHFGLSE